MQLPVQDLRFGTRTREGVNVIGCQVTHVYVENLHQREKENNRIQERGHRPFEPESCFMGTESNEQRPVCDILLK